MDSSDNHNETFLRLFTHHQPELRAFVRACLPRPADVDEVMQEVSLVAWKKFSTLEDLNLFPRWACLIARFEILKFRRAHARDRLVFDEGLMELLTSEGADELPLRQRQSTALDNCVAKLPRDRRELVIAAYAPETSIKRLAQQLGRTEGMLYQMLARIRQELLRCVQRALSRNELGT